MLYTSTIPCVIFIPLSAVLFPAIDVDFDEDEDPLCIVDREWIISSLSRLDFSLFIRTMALASSCRADCTIRQVGCEIAELSQLSFLPSKACFHPS